jgi:hypothetical protein
MNFNHGNEAAAVTITVAFAPLSSLLLPPSSPSQPQPLPPPFLLLPF